MSQLSSLYWYFLHICVLFRPSYPSPFQPTPADVWQAFQPRLSGAGITSPELLSRSRAPSPLHQTSSGRRACADPNGSSLSCSRGRQGPRIPLRAGSPAAGVPCTALRRSQHVMSCGRHHSKIVERFIGEPSEDEVVRAFRRMNLAGLRPPDATRHPALAGDGPNRVGFHDRPSQSRSLLGAVPGGVLAGLTVTAEKSRGSSPCEISCERLLGLERCRPGEPPEGASAFRDLRYPSGRV